jgi:hypothetical protein
MKLTLIDNPDVVIDWFDDYPQSERDRRPIGSCPHACAHPILRVVGWGPTLRHYELRICEDRCAGNCRGWCGPPTLARLMAIEWKMLGDPAVTS